jgi:hypothetical protein
VSGEFAKMRKNNPGRSRGIERLLEKKKVCVHGVTRWNKETLG